MKSQPKISVIIPVYNVEKYLEECLDSVINQTLTDIEVICVNDGSTDNSLNILKKYEKKDKRITVITQKNLYAGVARNNGFAISKGEYVHFFDSDDILSDNKVYEDVYNKLKEVNFPDVIHGFADRFDNKTLKQIDEKDNYKNTNKSFFIDKNDIDSLLKLSVVPWLSFFKSDFIRKNNITFPNLKCSNDVFFFFKSIFSLDTIYLYNRKFVNYRVNNDKSLVGIRHKFFDCQISDFYLIKDFLNEKKIHKQIIKKILLKKLNELFSRYRSYMADRRKHSYKLHCQVIEFCNNYDITELYPEIKKQWYFKTYRRFKKFNNISKLLYPIQIYIYKMHFMKKKIFEFIFSIKNNYNKTHKIITILGIKIRIKRKKFI